MSDDINPIDLLAAEYALGLLEGEDRVSAARRAETDPEFRTRVEFWETRLASLLETLEERPAPAGTKARIEAALFGKAAPSAFSEADRVARSCLRGGQPASHGRVAPGAFVRPLSQCTFDTSTAGSWNYGERV